MHKLPYSWFTTVFALHYRGRDDWLKTFRIYFHANSSLFHWSVRRQLWLNILLLQQFGKSLAYAFWKCVISSESPRPGVTRGTKSHHRKCSYKGRSPQKVKVFVYRKVCKTNSGFCPTKTVKTGSHVSKIWHKKSVNSLAVHERPDNSTFL